MTDFELIAILKNQVNVLTEQIEEQKEVLEHREQFIDWVIKNYPDVVSEYLGWKE